MKKEEPIDEREELNDNSEEPLYESEELNHNCEEPLYESEELNHNSKEPPYESEEPIDPSEGIIKQDVAIDERKEETKQSNESID